MPCRFAPKSATLALAAVFFIGCSDGGTGTPDPDPDPAPTVSAVQPASVIAGSAATMFSVTGTGFVARSVVRWNDVTRPTSYQSATRLDVTLPATDLSAAGTGTLSVITPAPGGGASGNLTVTINNPAPAITSITPSTFVAGTNAGTVTVTGTGFVSTSQVQWNGAARPTTYQNATTITVALTAPDLATAGNGTLLVVNPAPGGGTSNSSSVPITAGTVDPPAPNIASLSPSSVPVGSPSFLLAVAGSNFTPTSQVQWNGVARATTFIDATALRISVTAADVATAGTATVSVVTPPPGGGQSASLPFAITAPLQIQSISRVSMSASTACALDASNRARCWGRGVQGHVGDGALVDRASPVDVAGNHQYRSISVGSAYGCGVTTANALLCWGGYTQPSILTSAIPAVVAISEVPTMVSVAVTDPFLCALAQTGAVWCLGGNNTNIQGQHGVGNTSDASYVMRKVTGGHTFAALDVGRSHACALTTTGQAWCWGAAGVLGAGPGLPFANPTPLQVLGGLTFSRISAGENHTCALTPAGEAWCWGSGTSGALGNGSSLSRTEPAQVAGGLRFTEISVARNQSCAVSTTRDIWCWGRGQYGAMGVGDESGSTTPRMVIAGGTQFIDIGVGTEGACALDISNVTWCWGNEERGALGNGATGSVNEPTLIPGTSGFIAIEAELERTCALRDDGRVFCWGDFGDQGNNVGTWTNNFSVQPTQVGTATLFSSIAVAEEHTCARTAAGKVWCWGNGADGRLGNGSTASSTSPVLVSGLDVFSDLSAGGGTTCGTVATGVVCWGDGASGRLGNGGTADASAPVAVSAGADLSRVSVGSSAACALDSSNQGFCWGSSLSSALGNGSSIDRLVPTAILTAARFQALYIGYTFSCGRAGMAMHCWGINIGGRRGFPGGIPQDQGLTPSLLPGAADWMSISVGGARHACGLAVGGTLRCWGSSLNGELGIGPPRDRIDIPIGPVPGAGAMQAVTTGINHSCGLGTAGAIYCWGQTMRGRLGNGQRGFQAFPVRAGN